MIASSGRLGLTEMMNRTESASMKRIGELEQYNTTLKLQDQELKQQDQLQSRDLFQIRHAVQTTLNRGGFSQPSNSE